MKFLLEETGKLQSGAVEKITRAELRIIKNRK